MSANRDLREFESGGREACLRGGRANPPRGFGHAERTAWVGGYQEQLGYERASGNGAINLFDADERTFCSKCRFAGAARYYREAVAMESAAEAQNSAGASD